MSFADEAQTALQQFDTEARALVARVESVMDQADDRHWIGGYTAPHGCVRFGYRKDGDSPQARRYALLSLVDHHITMRHVSPEHPAEIVLYPKGVEGLYELLGQDRHPLAAGGGR